MSMECISNISDKIIIKQQILDDERYGYEYTEIDNIKLYNGLDKFNKLYYSAQIEEEKKKLKGRNLFTKLLPNTLTANSNISNIYFKEFELIKKLPILTDDDHILKIGCNFGELIHSSYSEPLIKKSKKGRKPRKQKKNNRRKNGVGDFIGKYFSSQMTFFIKGRPVQYPLSKTEFSLLIFKKCNINLSSPFINSLIRNYIGNIVKTKNFLNKNKRCCIHKKFSLTDIIKIDCDECLSKIYQIKIFRNGNIQIPGVLSPTFDDIIRPMSILIKYLKKFYKNENIKINYIMSEMRNYSCRISNENYKIDLHALKNVLKLEKNRKLLFDSDIQSVLSKIELKFNWFSNILSLWKLCTPADLAEIYFNTEKCSALMIKFYRPTYIKLNKKFTIKISTSGKINFDGGFSELQTYHLYYWLQNFIFRYFDKIIYDSSFVDDEESSICSNSSIYDDML